MNNGWIKIHRKLLEWEWYDEPNTFRLFIHLLLKANHKPKNYRGVNIETGQIMTGLNLLAEQTGLTVQKIRTALNNLKATSEITSKTTNKGTVIQIVKYSDYQIETNKTTNKQQTNNKQTTTNNNYNNINKDNIIYREAEFKNSLQQYLDTYGEKMLNNFYLYWTEKKPKGKKMKFEMEKTFDISRRLMRWNNNNFNNKNDKDEKRKQISDFETRIRNGENIFTTPIDEIGSGNEQT